MGQFVNGTWRDGGDFPHDTTRPFRPARRAVPQLGHRERRSRAERRRRLQGGGRPLSSHRLARLPVGAPHPDLPPAQRPREHDLALGRPLAAGRARLDLRSRPRRHSRSDLRREASCANSMSRRGPTTAAASPCRCCGTRRRARSSTTNCPKSSACSTAPSMASARRRATIIRAASGRRSTRSTRASIATVNNGVYRAGFATTQEAYEEAFRALFETLDWLEARLSGQRFLFGRAG